MMKPALDKPENQGLGLYACGSHYQIYIMPLPTFIC